jgi:drug/metabolite transporter (DMT)-like permease
MAVFGAFLACVLIWGSTWYMIEFQLGVVAKEWSVVYRFALAAILLQAWCWFRGIQSHFSIRGHATAAGTGIFLFGVNYLLVYAGTEYLTSGFVAVAFSSLSLMNILTARLILGIPFQRNVILMALLGFIGIILVFSREINTVSLNDTTLFGFSLCMAGTVIASTGNAIAASPTARSLPILPFTALGLFYSAGFNTLVALASGEPISFDMSMPYVLSLMGLSFFGTVVAFGLYLWLINEIGITRAGYIAVATPLVALTISTVFEGFQWSPEALAGVACIILGNAGMVAWKTKPATPAEKPI